MTPRNAIRLSWLMLVFSVASCGGDAVPNRSDAGSGDGGGTTGAPSTGNGGAGGAPTSPGDGSYGGAKADAAAGGAGGNDGGRAETSPPPSLDAGAGDQRALDGPGADAGARWAPACPGGFVPMPGVNTAFPTPTGMRAFSLNLPADTSTPRSVWVPLTGSVESTNENLDARGGNRKLIGDGYIVIGPVRRCAVTVDGAGTPDNGGACNMGGSGGWTWNPWNEGRVFGAAGNPWKTDEGPDSKFLEAVVKCVATRWPVDQTRLFIGGISSGATMTNRALTFRSDFWAGGMPISGEWYVTRDDGTSWGADDFSARRAAVANDPTRIFQGRVGPFPLAAALGPMIVISVWGGPADQWSCAGVLCADYRPTTQIASNYFSSMSNVVHVACSSTHGHQWPTINRDAFNQWALTTLSSHPKGTPKSSFTLTPPPPGYTCTAGAFTDHY